MHYKEDIITPTKVNELFDKSSRIINDYEMDAIINNISEQIADSYIECAIHNHNQTTEKIKLLNRAYVFILISITLLFVSFLLSVLL